MVRTISVYIFKMTCQSEWLYLNWQCNWTWVDKREVKTKILGNSMYYVTMKMGISSCGEGSLIWSLLTRLFPRYSRLINSSVTFFQTKTFSGSSVFLMVLFLFFRFCHTSCSQHFCKELFKHRWRQNGKFVQNIFLSWSTSKGCIVLCHGKLNGCNLDFSSNI